MSLLKQYYKFKELEAGVDEAGRGCLAGPVFAAAVVFPSGITIEGLNDSKKLSAKKRTILSEMIKKEALAFSVYSIENDIIDEINILNASILAMKMAIQRLTIQPKFILIDGNRFDKEFNLPFETIVKGDSKFQSIAAASILAKTSRDEYMSILHNKYPMYNWEKNKGYPSLEHKKLIQKHGLTKYHRRTFNSSLTQKQSIM